MARIPTFKYLLKEAYPSESKWIGPFISTLNAFMDDVVNAMNKRFTFTENFDGEVKEITAAGTYPIDLKWDRQRPTMGHIVFISRDTDESFTLSAAPFVQWHYTQESQIRIDDIVGLDDSITKKYKVRILFVVA